MELTWEQKLEALQALAEFPNMVTISMRKPGDWYCSVSGIEVRKSHTLESRYGNGDTPQEAVENCFLVLTTIQRDEVLARNALGDKSKHFRWNGFMWNEEELAS